MSPTNALPSAYGATAKCLHWLVAVGVITAFGLGWVMTDIAGITPTKLRYYNWHKWLGVSLFALSLVRLTWRAFHPPPPLPSGLSNFQRHGAQAMHVALYAATLAVPVSGYLYTLAAGFPVVYLGWIELPVFFGKTPALIEPLKLLHQVAAYTMASGVLLHAGAAFFHHFRDRDGVLLRMLPRFLAKRPS